MKKLIACAFVLGLFLSLGLATWESGSDGLNLVQTAEAKPETWKHCFCYDIEEPVNPSNPVWHCKDGFFVTSITQQGAGPETKAADAAYITEIQCCSLCY